MYPPNMGKVVKSFLYTNEDEIERNLVYISIEQA